MTSVICKHIIVAPHSCPFLQRHSPIAMETQRHDIMSIYRLVYSANKPTNFLYLIRPNISMLHFIAFHSFNGASIIINGTRGQGTTSISTLLTTNKSVITFPLYTFMHLDNSLSLFRSLIDTHITVDGTQKHDVISIT